MKGHRSDLSGAEIVEEVAAAYGIGVREIYGRRRHRYVAWPRQEVMWRLRLEKGWSYPDIGDFLRHRDHTTIIYGVRAHQKRLNERATRTADDDPLGYSLCL